MLHIQRCDINPSRRYYDECDVYCQQSLVDGLKLSCKCHGVSGSCNVKTCWNAVSDLHAVGTALFQTYSRAVRLAKMAPPVTASRRLFERDVPQQMQQTSQIGRNRRQGQSRRRGIRRRELSIDKGHLVYYNISSDYCSKNPAAGSYGTRNR